jgi:prepilin-type N-terminal cleavage/methylation domain-containing protein
MRKLSQKGFTIIELLIATAVFSVVLLIITGAIIQFSKIYYKSVISSRTQESARNIISDIGAAVQFSGTASVSNTALSPTTGYLCIGSKRYTYRYNIQVTATQHALVADSPASCTGPYPSMTTTIPSGSSASELLGVDMQLLGIDVSAVTGSTSLYNVALNVAYGKATDMIDDVKADGTSGSDGIMDRCRIIIQGGQFCAVTKLSTTVAKRIN